jgi:methanogenic corrinoid protein MtbC1
MYTIRQVTQLTGVPESSLRAWERRYQVVAPRRNESGYRIYDDQAVEALIAMRRLLDAGWAPAQAAGAVKEGVDAELLRTSRRVARAAGAPADGAVGALESFLAAAAALDVVGLEDALDQGFALGSFEHVAETWLSPTLQALGEGWAQGEIDVAGEHLASHAVHRRLAAAFESAGRRSRGPSVVVGLPPGSLHELGALMFATAARRIGFNVTYLGANVPQESWQVAVEHRPADAVVMSVVMADDVPAAQSTAAHLRTVRPDMVVAMGGAASADVVGATHHLPDAVTRATEELDELLSSQTAH